MSSENRTNIPNSLNEHWMPFTSNKDFKKNPRLLTEAKGVYLKTHQLILLCWLLFLIWYFELAFFLVAILCKILYTLTIFIGIILGALNSPYDTIQQTCLWSFTLIHERKL